MAFALTKWYVDVATDDGRTAIAYRMAVRAGPLEVAAAGLLHWAGGPVVSTFSTRAGAGPMESANDLVWESPGLDLRVEVTRGAPAIAQSLLDSPTGAVRWTAWSPAASVRLAARGRIWEGMGYTERLELSMAPWAVPVDTFHWGRFIGGGRSLVWIAWLGPHPLRLAWLDGVAVPLGAVDRDGVAFAPSGVATGGTLQLADAVTLTDHGIRRQLHALAPLRHLADHLPHSHQTRWRSRGTLRTAGAADAQGWAIHEVVRWR